MRKIDDDDDERERENSILSRHFFVVARFYRLNVHFLTMILDRHQLAHRLINTILRHADLDQLEILLRKSSRLQIDLNDFEYDGQSLLHLCCLHNRLDLMKLLVESGQCDVFLLNRDGWLPIHLAVYLGHMNIVVYLLQSMKI